jgi:hypothetical protein
MVRKYAMNMPNINTQVGVWDRVSEIKCDLLGGAKYGCHNTNVRMDLRNQSSQHRLGVRRNWLSASWQHNLSQKVLDGSLRGRLDRACVALVAVSDELLFIVLPAECRCLIDPGTLSRERE